MTTSIKAARDYLNSDDTDNIDLGVKRIANELLDELEQHRTNGIDSWLAKFEPTCNFEIDAERMFNAGALTLPAFRDTIERHRMTGKFDMRVAEWAGQNGHTPEEGGTPEFFSGFKPAAEPAEKVAADHEQTSITDSRKEQRALQHESRLRELALDQAIRSNGMGFGSSAENTVASAEKFLAFLKGES